MTIIKDISKLVGASSLAQLLSIIAAPFITRLYGPEAFGISALFISISTIFSAIACMRYEIAVMMPEKDEDASYLLCLSLGLVLLISIASIPIFWLGESIFLDLLNVPKLGPYLWLMPLSIFLNGAFMALNYWTIRTEQFGNLSIARIFNSATATSFQIGSGFIGRSTAGSLIYSAIFGSIISIGVIGTRIWQRDHYILKNSVDVQKIFAGLVRYRKFPLYDTWSVLLNSISAYLPIFILSSFFSSTVIGYYALGFMVLQFPLSILGGAIAQVFFQRATVAKLQDRLSSFTESTFLTLGLIGLLPTIIVSLTGKEIFTLVFGGSWAEAGVYVQILAFWIFLVFITSPISSLFSILERQRSSLLINSATILARSAALIIGCMAGDIRLALILFSAVGVIFTGGSCAWILSQANVSITSLLIRYRNYLFFGLISFLLIFLSNTYVKLSPFIVTSLICFIFLIYYYSLYKDLRLIYDRDVIGCQAFGV